MSILEIFFLAIGLSMDAFAVSVCKGLSVGKIKLRHCLIAGAWFGGFQGLMPLIGYLLTGLFAEQIDAFDHWIAFGLLAVIGLNMIREAAGKDEEKKDDKMDIKTMLLMAVCGARWLATVRSRIMITSQKIGGVMAIPKSNSARVIS